MNIDNFKQNVIKWYKLFYWHGAWENLDIVKVPKDK